MIPNESKKKTTVWSINPNAVGHPLIATPGITEFTNRKVTGFATKKKISAEYNENFAFNAVVNAIYIVAEEKS
jgi:hypothetical protein